MKILVTGGTGFIGSAVCHHLMADGQTEIVNLDKLTYAANPRSVQALEGNPRYHFIKADICDRTGMESLFAAQQPDAVMHLAAESHVDRSITGAGDFIQTNVMGTFTLLDVALEYWRKLDSVRQNSFRFLHVSTDEVFGSLGKEGLFSETTRYDPSSPYSASKASSDHLARAWHRTYGLPVLISNCSNNYGPRQFPEKLIPLMMISALENRALPVYGDGSNVRDWLHVEDHARALKLILDKGRPGETYNVGGRNERSNLQVVQHICDLMDELRPGATPRRQLITFVTDRPGHDARYAIDAGKLETELGWRAEQTFETGLRQTIQWYLDNEDWWRPLHEKVYAGERLGLQPQGD